MWSPPLSAYRVSGTLATLRVLPRKQQLALEHTTPHHHSDNHPSALLGRAANQSSPPVPSAPVVPSGDVASLSAGDECHDDVGGVAVEVLASPVVDRRGSGIGMAGCDLDVSQRDAGVE